MNSIDFLISLIDNYNNFHLLINDFILVLENFSPSMFDLNFSYTNISGQDFLAKINEDFKTITYDQVIKLSDALAPLNEYKKSSETPLEKTIRDNLTNYYINNPDIINLDKYYKIMVNKIIFDIENELDCKIHLKYNEEKNTFASIGEDYQSYALYFNENNRKGLNKKAVIYRIYESLYHEEYHLIVNLLSKDPKCFKIDILKFQIVRVLRNIFPTELSNSFYKYFYEHLKEENNAEIYGIKKAHEKLLNINPKFEIPTFSKIYNLDQQSRSINNTMSLRHFDKSQKLISEDDYFEDFLDKIIINNPEEIRGIISYMYNPNGTRKDISTLINDLENNLKEYPSLSKDITEFYYYLIYRFILKLNHADLTNYLTDNKTKDLIYKSLLFNQKLLETELHNINTHKLYYLLNIYNNTFNKKVILNKITNINNLLNELSNRIGEPQNAHR